MAIDYQRAGLFVRWAGASCDSGGGAGGDSEAVERGEARDEARERPDEEENNVLEKTEEPGVIGVCGACSNDGVS
ncbi:MAG: hypothetical protein A2103_01310 [Gammaproteobacteria bacterium GWF2_41_13]|nr:MAG: hypothetical protein A2103_01310 [Gammaproteobacteria bacterium GWF2_41_13]